jgi:hypothetical protein
VARRAVGVTDLWHAASVKRMFVLDKRERPSASS